MCQRICPTLQDHCLRLKMLNDPLNDGLKCILVAYVVHPIEKREVYRVSFSRVFSYFIQVSRPRKETLSVFVERTSHHPSSIQVGGKQQFSNRTRSSGTLPWAGRRRGGCCCKKLQLRGAKASLVPRASLHRSRPVQPAAITSRWASMSLLRFKNYLFVQKKASSTPSP